MPNEAEKLAAVARQWYIHGDSQDKIAKDLGVGQSAVSNWLVKARDRGVVSIDIDADFALSGEEHKWYSRRLRNDYGLSECLIVDPMDESIYTDGRGDELHTLIANTAGRIYLREWIRSDDHVVVGGGRAPLRVARFIKRVAPTRHGVCISPLSGRIWTGVWQDAGRENLQRPMDADDVARLLGFAFESEPGTRFSQIGHPLYAENPAAAQRIIADECVFQPNGRWSPKRGLRSPVRALVGVGVLHPRSGHRISEFLNRISKDPKDSAAPHLKIAAARFTKAMMFAESHRLPFIGDLANRLFPTLPLPSDLTREQTLLAPGLYEEMGRLLDALNSCAVVMEWEHLRTIPHVCAVAGGDLKLRVLWTLLICGRLDTDTEKGNPLVNELMTDVKTAEALRSCMRDFEGAPSDVRDWFRAIAPTIFASPNRQVAPTPTRRRAGGSPGS